MMNNPIIYCAIDKPDIDAALKLCAQITSEGLGIKLGLEFFNALGPQGILKIHNAYPKTPIFLDLKYHDIPNTVLGAITSIFKKFEPSFMNVHAAGGYEMMLAAHIARNNHPNTKLLAVTILTSLDEQAIIDIGYNDGIRNRVIQMAKLAQKAGLDGVVCSSHEISAIRKTCGENFILMVPGIRPENYLPQGINDQKRVMTPREAMDKGATHLVIGRPITQSPDPQKASREILKSLS
jgi:orotidine-5'-phosphate decarboxylase